MCSYVYNKEKVPLIKAQKERKKSASPKVPLLRIIKEREKKDPPFLVFRVLKIQCV